MPYFIAIALRGACPPLICKMFRFCDFLYFCFEYTFCLGLAPSSNRWTNFNRYGLNSPPSSKDVLFVGLMTIHDFKLFKAPKTLQKAAWHFPAKLAVIKSQYLRRRISGATLVKDSDVKFHEIFCPEIFHEIFHLSEIFTNFTMFFPALCIVHCNKVSKRVKGKYLLLCMNSIIYLLLT